MTLRKALLAATVLAALPIAAARSQPVTGLYVGAGVGANFRHAPSDRGIKLETEDAGWVGLGAVGWGFGNGLRAEVEGNYRFNEASETRFNGARVGNGGYLRTYGVMGNVLYDFNIPTPRLPLLGSFAPYIGVGAGYAWNEISKTRFTVAGSTYRIDDTDAQFAFQGIVGAAFNLGALAPGLALTAEYRFFGTLEPSLNVDRLTGVGPRTVTTSYKPDNYNHSVLLGVRYALFQPAPPPPAPAPVVAPAPAPARTYLVFFDWDRADLTARAREIIAEAAQNSRRVQATRVEVAGHADRSGSAQYNQRLSQRRAETVAAELVRNGVSRNEITVTAFGESRPLVPTADGVREPQNRRVEIVLR